MENSKQTRERCAQLRGACVQLGKGFHQLETKAVPPTAEDLAECLYALFELQRNVTDMLVQAACWELVKLRGG